MKHSEDLEKLDPQVFAGINEIKNFLKKENIDFSINKTEITLLSNNDYNIIESKIDDIIDSLNFETVIITKISSFLKNIINIKFSENKDNIKIIFNPNIIDGLKNKINKLIG